MTTLSHEAAAALRDATVSRGPNKGLLLARPPRSNTFAYAAWMGAVAVCNPFKLSVCGMMFMTTGQRAIFNEVEAALAPFKPKLDRDRNALQALGVW